MFNVLFRKCVHSRSTIINFQVENYESAHHSRETPLQALIEGVCASTIYMYTKSMSVKQGWILGKISCKKLESQRDERDRYLYTALFNTLP